MIGNSLYGNKNHGILLVNSNSSELIGNSAWNNNFAGICVNSSINNNITDNTLDNNLYGILLENSNYSRIVNNTGRNNNYGVVEIYCVDNVIEDNIFTIDIIRQTSEDSNSKKKDYLSVDFTIILLIILSVVVFIIIAINVFSKKISKSFISSK